MANLMKRSSTKPDSRCKKHPKHQQSPGVCSLCLREKLSQLPTFSSGTTKLHTRTGSSSSSSVSSYYSSSSASSCSSPMHGYRFTTTSEHHHQGKISLSLLLFGGKNNVLTKSRSLASVPRNRDAVKKVKKAGFFSKLLLRPRNNKKIEQGLVHSRTMREITVTT